MLAGRKFKKIVANRLSKNFREATSIVEAVVPNELKGTELLVRNVFVGINASDVNFTAGVYQPGVIPPFDCGLEALGEVVAAGENVKGIAPGDAVATQSYGAFSEYQVVPSRHARKAPSLKVGYLPLSLSGATALIALRDVLKPQKGERAVVTAASGGTGQFAVQLLKNLYGCTVVGMCSSPRKAEFLTSSLKCDAVINYRAERGIADAVHRVYPLGANIAYESVGGDVLDAVVQAMAFRGRILSIGSTVNYTGENESYAPRKSNVLSLALLSHSATLHTFFLPHFAKHITRGFNELCGLYEQGVIKSFVDSTEFKGIEKVYDAIDHMYARKNIGKIVVEL
ncbi:unnamed protein product [Phytomonas sp. EM1]|nr:unnamed protein product [Phytomonas sp. EM1]|eukprot:CCW61877.1 unnamed protein product [Phytomonas sp. isolate EM1]